MIGTRVRLAGASLGLLKQLLLTCGARLSHSGPDSTARRCDLLVAFAFGAPLEIVEPASRKNKMGVGIDESGQHNRTTRIDNFSITRAFLDLVTRTDGNDHAVVNEHAAIWNDGDFA